MTSADDGAQQESTVNTSVVTEPEKSIDDTSIAAEETPPELVLAPPEPEVSPEEVSAALPIDPREPEASTEPISPAGLIDPREPEVPTEPVSPAQPNDPPEPAAVVGMTNTLTFSPLSVTIRVGETVEWRNTSLLIHTVTGDPAKATVDGSVSLPPGAESFDSGNMNPEATFRHTFQTPGTYRYFCIPHEGTRMRGTVIVE